MLLVDSEAPVNPEHQAGQAADWQPWRHLKARDNWPEPAGATDADCHLMVQCMESWFLADRDTLAGYFGHGFRGNALPATDAIEGIAKEQVMDGLQQATHACPTKGRYNKGQHSFELLGKIRPRRVCDQSPWARRFIGRLETKMSA